MFARNIYNMFKLLDKDIRVATQDVLFDCFEEATYEKYYVDGTSIHCIFIHEKPSNKSLYTVQRSNIHVFVHVETHMTYCDHTSTSYRKLENKIYDLAKPCSSLNFVDEGNTMLHLGLAQNLTVNGNNVCVCLFGPVSKDVIYIEQNNGCMVYNVLLQHHIDMNEYYMQDSDNCTTVLVRDYDDFVDMERMRWHHRWARKWKRFCIGVQKLFK